jgi:hypothetical protein
MKVYNVLVINEVNEIKTFDTKEKARNFVDERIAEIEDDYDIEVNEDNYVYAFGEDDVYTMEIFENEVE